MNEITKETLRTRDQRLSDELGGLFYGVYTGTVADNQDPAQQGRIKVTLPWLTDDNAPSLWARHAVLSAGPDHGSRFTPAVGTEVLVAFEAGDVSRPYIVGALWNGVDRPPETSDKQGYDTQVLSTSRGTRVVFDENADGGTLRLETAGGQRVQLTDSPEGLIIEDASGSRIKLEPSGICIETPTKVEVKAAQVDVSAAVVSLDAAMVQASGVVKCTTLQTDTVIASTYTPGAGNVW